MSEHAVVIAGGGPAGMMLAAELALAKVDVAVVERRPNHVLVGSRAGGFHSRTIEVLDQRGVADRFLAEGHVAQVATFATTVLDMSGCKRGSLPLKPREVRGGARHRRCGRRDGATALGCSTCAVAFLPSPSRSSRPGAARRRL
jgi:2-polyprenyl-6-methoxyphenol hydroxylase-like FAD-dependent oxidoreductase